MCIYLFKSTFLTMRYVYVNYFRDANKIDRYRNALVARGAV